MKLLTITSVHFINLLYTVDRDAVEKELLKLSNKGFVILKDD